MKTKTNTIIQQALILIVVILVGAVVTLLVNSNRPHSLVVEPTQSWSNDQSPPENKPARQSDNPTTSDDSIDTNSEEPSDPDKVIPDEVATVNSTEPEGLIKTFTGVSPFPEEVLGDKFVVNGVTYDINEFELLLTPNDPDYEHWWVNDHGLRAAWDIGSGSYQTSIAIIDTGFDLNHEEFVGRWQTNDDESGATAAENPSILNCTDQSISLDASCNNIDDDHDGVLDNESGLVFRENPSRLNCTDQSITLDKQCNLVDDDSNGLVDDYLGWDFANFDRVVEAGETNPNAWGSGLTHGTNVAGIAAATGNNGAGIAGVDWQTKILPLQVFDDDSSATTLSVSRAIKYAADRGVDVISLSLGTYAADAYLRDAVDYALDRNSVVVAASGNDGCSCLVYPANFPEVVAVGAINKNGVRASFSSYGPNLDITAPGTLMTSPTWSQSSDSVYAAGIAGTSFSTPLVSGLLSMAKSHQPTASWGDLVAALNENSIRKSTNPRNNNYGYGVAKASSFLRRLTTRSIDLTQSYQLVSLSSVDLFAVSSARLCEPSELGSFEVIEMTMNSEVVFTTSYVEQLALESQGWTTSNRLGHGCVNLGIDNHQSVKEINLHQEFSAGLKPPPT